MPASQKPRCCGRCWPQPRSMAGESVPRIDLTALSLIRRRTSLTWNSRNAGQIHAPQQHQIYLSRRSAAPSTAGGHRLQQAGPSLVAQQGARFARPRVLSECWSACSLASLQLEGPSTATASSDSSRARLRVEALLSPRTVSRCTGRRRQSGGEQQSTKALWLGTGPSPSAEAMTR